MRRQACSIVLIFLMTHSYAFESAYAKPSKFYLVPPHLVPKTSSEYYSTNSNVKVVIPIQVWGSVNLPGIHYVKPNAKISEVISAAGGPTSNADIDEIQLISGNKKKYLSLFDKKTNAYPLRANDTIYLDSAWKAELPLIFGGITAIVSIVTLYFISKNNN